MFSCKKFSSLSYCIYESWLKSSQDNKNTPIECDQMRFIFQHNLSSGLHNSSINVGFHWSKEINSRYEFLQLLLCWVQPPGLLYDHLLPISKTIQVRWTRHVGHCWRSRDKLISDILLWTPSHGRAKVERPARTYIQQLHANTECTLEGLPGAMDEVGEGQGDPCWRYNMMMMNSWPNINVTTKIFIWASHVKSSPMFKVFIQIVSTDDYLSFEQNLMYIHC